MGRHPRRVALVHALSDPASCLADPELRTASIASDRTTGLPEARAGARSLIFEATTDRRWALKCFLMPHAGRAARYRELVPAVAALDIAHLPPIDHHPYGLTVDGVTSDVVALRWVDGVDLVTWVQANLDDPVRIGRMATRLASVVGHLEGARVGHGDLQHGTILVTPNDEIILLGHEALWVPTLAGSGPAFAAHPNYRSSRSASTWGPTAHRYVAWTTYATLLALSLDPDLFHRVPTAGDRRLLLGEADHVSLSDSPVVALIAASTRPELRDIAGRLAAVGAMDPVALPPLDVASLPPVPVEAWWDGPGQEEARERRSELLARCRTEVADRALGEAARLGAVWGRRRSLLAEAQLPAAPRLDLASHAIADELGRRLDRQVIAALAEVGITTAADVTWTGALSEGAGRVKAASHRGRGFELSAADRRIIGLWRDAMGPVNDHLDQVGREKVGPLADALAALAEEESMIRWELQGARSRASAVSAAELLLLGQASDPAVEPGLRSDSEGETATPAAPG